MMDQDKTDKKPFGKKPLSRRARRLMLIGGAVLVAGALVLIGMAVYNILNANLLTESSLSEAKQLVAELRPPEGERAEPADPIDPSDPAASETPSVEVPGPLVNRPAGEVLGYLVFETIKDGDKPREVPIIEGAEPKQLDKGAGHHEDMAYPGQSGNCLIFGHRNTVFRDFGKLKVGAAIRAETPYGSFVYKIEDMQVVEPLNPLMFKGYREPMLTLVTCYPFHYLGHAPKRYVVVCRLESSTPAGSEPSVPKED